MTAEGEPLQGLDDEPEYERNTQEERERYNDLQTHNRYHAELDAEEKEWYAAERQRIDDEVEAELRKDGNTDEG